MAETPGIIPSRRPPRSAAPILLGVMLALAALIFAGCADATVTVYSGTPGGSGAGSTATATSAAPTATPNPGRYNGTWVDNAAGANGTAGELVITSSGTQATVHGYGICGTKCDWNTATSTVGSFNLVVNYTLDSAESAQLTIQLSSNNLQVVDNDTYYGNHTYLMHRASATEARAFLYLGAWVNNDSSSGGPPELIVSGVGTALTVHGYGACTPTYCDWGTRNGTYSADPFAVSFNNINGSGITNNLSLTLQDSAGNSLKCVMVGSASGTNTYMFHKSLIA